MIFALGAVIGPGLGGLIYHELGNTILWDLCGLFGLLCLLVCSISKKYY